MTSGPSKPDAEFCEPTSISAILTKDHQDMEAIIREAERTLPLGSAAEAFAALDRLWIRLAVHIRAEHKGLFPVLGVARPDLMGDLGHLREDHDFFMASLAVAVRTMQGPAPDFTKAEALLEGVRQRLVPHNALEESAIYFVAERLSPDPRGQIMKVITRELAFLPGRHRS